MTTTRTRRRILLGERAKQVCPTTGKMQFASPESAAKELKTVQVTRKAKRDKRVESRYYRCGSCFEYHLTSK